MAKSPRQFLANRRSGPAFETIDDPDLSRSNAVLGPGASGVDTIPVFADRTGRLLADSGIAITALFTKLIAQTTDPTDPVENQIWLFSDEATPANLYLVWWHGGERYAFPIGTAIS